MWRNRTGPAMRFASLLVALAATTLMAATPLGARGGSPLAQEAGTHARKTGEVAPQDTPKAGTDTLVRALVGRVMSEGTGAPLPFALVEAGIGPTYRVTMTDARGRYRLADVAPGRQRLRVTTLDHAPLEVVVQVPAGGEVGLDLLLRLRPVDVSGIVVIAHSGANVAPLGGGPAPRGSPADPALRALEATPGVAELGLAEGARSEPHVNPKDPESALYVRGAASDLKLVLLDGAPVYAPYHLAGLIQAFQPGVLRSARLYAGGAPSRYDGGLSYILELTTRQGSRDAIRSSGAIDLLGAGARIEGPFPGGSFLAGGRTMDGTGADRLTGNPLPYDYGDALLRLDLGPSPGSHLSATGFFNRESVDLADTSGMRETAYWGNLAGSLRYGTRLGDSELELGAGIGEFSTRLPIGIANPGIAEGRSTRALITADVVQPIGDVLIGYGASYDRQELEYRARYADAPDSWLHRRGVADAAGAYGEGTWRPAENLELRGGLRANVFASASEVRLAPRASLVWSLSEESALSLAAGRYHQYVRTPETLLSSDLSEGWEEFAYGGPVADSAASLDPEASLRQFNVAGATHLVVGLDHLPSPDLQLGMEAFYKTFDGTPDVTGLRSSGLDLWVNWMRRGWAAWAGYSLAWAWTETDTTRFRARQLLSGGVQVPLPSGVHVDLVLASSNGQPFTSIPTRSAAPTAGENLDEGEYPVAQTEPRLAGAPEGSYLRLDAQVSRSWNASILGQRVELTPYLRVLNALDRRDALFYQFDSGSDLRPRSLYAVPLLPVIGIEWRQ